MAKKQKVRAHKKLDTRKVKQGLESITSKLRALSENPGRNIGEDGVNAARNIATELQEINRAFREALKRAMMAEGKIKPGQTIKAGGKLVSLKLRPGRSKKSTNLDDYDLVFESIH